MLTLRVEDLGDRVGYVVQDGDTDLDVFDSRSEAEMYIRGMGMDRKDVVEIGIDLALDYARKHHGDQAHGCLTIMQHLSSVSMLVDALSGYEVDTVERLHVVSAAALHDIVEDTPVTIEDIRFNFCDEVAELVDVVTDRPGHNRYQRHLNTYWRIREKGSDAVLIKLCDRLANHARSLAYREHYLKMYVDEYPYFKMALWRPREHDRIWALLDAQYERMKDAHYGEGLQKGSGLSQDPGAGSEKQAA